MTSNCFFFGTELKVEVKASTSIASEERACFYCGDGFEDGAGGGDFFAAGGTRKFSFVLLTSFIVWDTEGMGQSCMPWSRALAQI